MGVFGAIPARVSDAIAAGQQGAVTVEVGGTLMSFVPDEIRDTPQVWWTRLGVFIETEGLVTSRHGTSHQRDATGWRLNRLRFRDYLPGAKVLVWSTAYTVFIYIRQGLPKREAAAAVRLALDAAGRRPLNVAHASIIGLGVAGALHFPLWVTHWPLPRGAVHTAAGALSLAAVAGASGLIFQWPVHATHSPVGGAELSPVTAQPAQVPDVPPVRPNPVATSPSPSSFVQAYPSLTPQPLRTTAPPTPQPKPTPSAVPEPVPSSVPEPLPSSQLPAPGPSAVGSDSPPPWWTSSGFPFPASGA